MSGVSRASSSAVTECSAVTCCVRHTARNIATVASAATGHLVTSRCLDVGIGIAMSRVTYVVLECALSRSVSLTPIVTNYVSYVLFPDT